MKKYCTTSVKRRHWKLNRTSFFLYLSVSTTSPPPHRVGRSNLFILYKSRWVKNEGEVIRGGAIGFGKYLSFGGGYLMEREFFFFFKVKQLDRSVLGAVYGMVGENWYRVMLNWWLNFFEVSCCGWCVKKNLMGLLAEACKLFFQLKLLNSNQ